MSRRGGRIRLYQLSTTAPSTTTERPSAQALSLRLSAVSKSMASTCIVSPFREPLKHEVRAGTTALMQAYSSHSRLRVGFLLDDLTATAQLATRLAQHCDAGDIVALHGTLGAGKTSFAREFIQALGLDEEV